jgi:hypothetical protein
MDLLLPPPLSTPVYFARFAVVGESGDGGFKPRRTSQPVVKRCGKRVEARRAFAELTFGRRRRNSCTVIDKPRLAVGIVFPDSASSNGLIDSHNLNQSKQKT